MIYGLYSSASGVISSAHRQDVHANNLANLDTTGFKRAISLARSRPPEAIESGRPDLSNRLFDEIGGSLFIAPTVIDHSPGPVEPSSSPLHLAIFGEGYFAVRDGDQVRLTRNGNFMLDRTGRLVMANEAGNRVLDSRQRPIRIDPATLDRLSIGEDGAITVDGETVARIGLFDVPDRGRLVPAGGTLLTVPQDAALVRARGARIQSGFVELSNVNAPAELVQLMDAHRQLEANANMMRFQDQTLAKLVNEVGKIG